MSAITLNSIKETLKSDAPLTFSSMHDAIKGDLEDTAFSFFSSLKPDIEFNNFTDIYDEDGGDTYIAKADVIDKDSTHPAYFICQGKEEESLCIFIVFGKKDASADDGISSFIQENFGWQGIEYSVLASIGGNILLPEIKDDVFQNNPALARFKNANLHLGENLLGKFELPHEGPIASIGHILPASFTTFEVALFVDKLEPDNSNDKSEPHTIQSISASIHWGTPYDIKNIENFTFEIENFLLQLTVYEPGQWPSLTIEAQLNVNKDNKPLISTQCKVITPQLDSNENLFVSAQTNLPLDVLGIDIPNSNLPDALKAELKNDLKGNLNIEFGKTFDVSTISFEAEIESTNGIDLGTSDIKINEIIFCVEKIENSYNFELRALATFFEIVKVKGSFNYPEKSFSVGLAEDAVVKIGDLAQKVIAATPDAVKNELNNFEIDDLEISGNLDEKSYFFSIDVHSTWSPIPAIILNQITIVIDFQLAKPAEGAQAATPSRNNIYILGDFTLAGVEFSASCEYLSEGNDTKVSLNASTGEDTEISIGAFITDLVEKLGGSDVKTPDAISSMKINYIAAAATIEQHKGDGTSVLNNTKNYNFQFELHGTTLFEEEKINLIVKLEVDKRDEGSKYSFTGILDALGREIEFDFEQQETTNYVIGSYSNPEGDHLALSSLIKAIVAGVDLPFDFSIVLKQIVLARIAEKASPTNYVFAVFLDLPIGLSGFPLIGDMLPKDIGFKDIQLVLAKEEVNKNALETINEKLNAEERILINTGSSAQQDESNIPKGLNFSGNFHLGENLPVFPLYLNFGAAKKVNKVVESGDSGKQLSNDQAATPNVEKPSAPPQPDERSQSKIDKVISAIRIKKVGLVFQDGRLGLKITGGLSLAVFEFELMGLQVSVPQSVLSNPADITNIKFDLDGFGAQIQKGELSIMGAFLRMHYPAENGHDAYDEYNGILQVALSKFSLAGIGSYAKYDGHPSLFLFVALGFPIPVHPSLLIQGMSLGFGIHRDAISPKLEDVLTYPLVQMSVTPPPPMDIADMVQKMHQYFPPTTDQYFVVAGIKFRAFGLIDNLAMLLVKFGREFEIDLIGVSSILLPSAFIELAWMAKFVPDTGYLFVGGQLTKRSYLFIPMAQLTGGFAVAAWMSGEHEGDFVASVGGYHPQFAVPAHYPDHLPRLGISFYLDPLSIKGGVYFAITPKCLMMGGFLKASLEKRIWGSSFNASIAINIDALINFSPFHYDLVVGADAEVKVDFSIIIHTFHIHGHFHFDMYIWGPDFSGTASIDIGPKTFDFEFGAASSVRALPITWDDFRKKFLLTEQDGTKKEGDVVVYENSKVCTASVTKGLIQKINKNGKETYVVDPKTVEIEVKSLIPLSAGNFGIAPMDIRGGITADLHIGTTLFDQEDLVDTVPKGIWGTEGLNLSSALSGDEMLIKEAKTGFKLWAKKATEEGATLAINKEALAYNTDNFVLEAPISAIKLNGVFGINTNTFNKPENSFEAFTGLKMEALVQLNGQ